MSWSSFVSVTIKINIAVVLILWIGFWGYGLLANEVPPVSVVPGLLLGTFLLCCALSLGFGLLIHSWLFVRALRNGEVMGLPRVAKVALLATMGFMIFAVLALTSNAGVALDAVASTVGVFGTTVAVVVFLATGSKGYFQWRFEK